MPNHIKVACRVRVAYLKEQNQIITLEKKKKNYVEKNEVQISGFAVTRKAPRPWKKFFSKKNSSSLFVQIWSSKRCAEIFLNKWVSRYLSLGDFKVPKNCSSQ